VECSNPNYAFCRGMIHPFWFYGGNDVSLSGSESGEVNDLPFHPVLFGLGLVRLLLGALVAVGLFYLLIKLAGLADAMTKTKRVAS